MAYPEKSETKWNKNPQYKTGLKFKDNWRS